MAVTSANPARGRPSSWSAAVDQLCFEEANRRLIILSAGNIAGDLTAADHLTRNDLEPVDDPAQAWNALTIGAFTDKVDIIDPDFARIRADRAGRRAVAAQPHIGDLGPPVASQT